MSSKSEMHLRFSLRRRIIAVAVLCTGVLWASVDAIAQDAAPAALKMPAHSTFSSLERARSNTSPYLVIGMAELGEPLPDGTLPPPQDEAANPSQRDTISPQLGPLTSPNHIGPEQSEPLFLSSLFTPTDGISGPADLHAEGTIRRQTIQSPSQGTGAKDFSLLDDRTSLGMFLYGDRFKYLPPRQWLAHNEFSKREVEEAPRPLLQLDFGNWSFSVLLSAAAFSR